MFMLNVTEFYEGANWKRLRHNWQSNQTEVGSAIDSIGFCSIGSLLLYHMKNIVSNNSFCFSSNRCKPFLNHLSVISVIDDYCEHFSTELHYVSRDLKLAHSPSPFQIIKIVSKHFRHLESIYAGADPEKNLTDFYLLVKYLTPAIVRY